VINGGRGPDLGLNEFQLEVLKFIHDVRKNLEKRFTTVKTGL